jgi:hypothetical protein
MHRGLGGFNLCNRGRSSHLNLKNSFFYFIHFICKDNHGRECVNMKDVPNPTSADDFGARRFAPHNQRMHLAAPVHDPFGLIPGRAADPQRLSLYIIR